MNLTGKDTRRTSPSWLSRQLAFSGNYGEKRTYQYTAARQADSSGVYFPFPGLDPFAQNWTYSPQTGDVLLEPTLSKHEPPDRRLVRVFLEIAVTRCENCTAQ